MKITPINNVLDFQGETEDEKIIAKKLSDFRLRLNGCMLEVSDIQENLLLTCDLTDNSIFVVNSNENAFEMANLLGAKRFILVENIPPSQKTIYFPRDRDFQLKSPYSVALTYEVIEGLEKIEKAIPKNQLYKELASLYKNYSEFTESKKLEYSQNEVEDKYCRYNSQSITPIIMVNPLKQIIGSIRLCQIPVKDGIHIYLSDEIVKYNHPDEREPLMAQLFEAARQSLSSRPNLKYAFIRVASGREPMYEKLGCSLSNTHIRVTQDAPTLLLEAIKTHVKNSVKYKLSLPALSLSVGHNAGEKPAAAVDDSSIALSSGFKKQM